MQHNKNKVELELTDFMIEKFKDVFDIELEILNGSITKMDDGRSRLVIFVSDQKIEMFKDFIRVMAQMPATDKVNITIAGVPINKN